MNVNNLHKPGCENYEWLYFLINFSRLMIFKIATLTSAVQKRAMTHN